MTGLELQPHKGHFGQEKVGTWIPGQMEEEAYVTPLGGMASCPTGAVYNVPVYEQTPIELAIGSGAPMPPRRNLPGQCPTLATFSIDKIIGPSIAEVVEMLVQPYSIPAPWFSIEAQRACRRLSIVPYLKVVVAWDDLLERSSEQVAATPQPEAPKAWRAFKDLGEWLEAPDEEIASALGIGRTTVYSWQRDNREPRRGTARRIYEFHSVLATLRRRLGDEQLTAWLAGGAPSRRELLLAGDLEAIDAAVDAEVFSGQERQPDLSWVGPDRGGVGPVEGADPPRARRRKPRRAKLR
jgi:transcriptional regulator with XRE-family HTH domain